MSWKISTRGIPQSITGVAPTLDYRFAIDRNEIETVSLTDKLTYTGGNGTFVGSDGFIQPATTNVPRFDHDPLSRQSLGLLSEVERTNLLLRSEEFDAVYWTKTLVTVAANDDISPNGQISAEKIAPTVDNGGHLVRRDVSGLTANAAYTLSFYAKSAGYSRAGLIIGTTDLSTRTTAEFNLNAASVTAQSGQLATSVESIGGGWVKISLSAQNIATTTYRCEIRVLSTGGVTDFYTGDGTSGIFIWGAQLEAASAPSTYIPTTTTSVTRTADSGVIDGTGVLTGAYTLVEKPAGCAVVSGTNINLQPGFTAERVMVFPAALDAGQITAIRGAM